MTLAYQLDDIQVRFNGCEVLSIPSLSIGPNQSTALLGENGSGKSTLMNLLAFVQTPNEGQIALFHETVTTGLTIRQRRRIGYVTQQPYMLNGSVQDNLKLALRLQQIPRSRHHELIERSLDLVDLLPQTNQDASTLSGGELKRAAIARAIVYEPDILLLDEPFSHLDQRHIRQLEKSIREFAAQDGKTVIFSTHDRLQARAIADNTINLVNGRVTSAPLLNLYYGQSQHQLFNTGKLMIHHINVDIEPHHIAIDPRKIIISRQPLQKTKLTNSFQGRLTQITEDAGHIRLLIDCGEQFYAVITPSSLNKLSIQLGDRVWVNFEPNAVSLF